ncbi:hypothetical protein BDW59DRAFT_162439 [Aspergillus cavernicola]|uniref:Uncharacterized protein n=1 Tax=Aspergillus cavernicola TaxID=176166 RepID=A0ABR4IA90_9EURO
MLQPRAMALRPRLVGWIEPSILSMRQFSISRTLDADYPPPTQSGPPKSSPDQSKRLKVPPALLKYKSSGSTTPRPRRIFDARSFAASKPGGQTGNILRGPPRLGGRGGTSPRARKPYNAKSGPKPPRRTGRRQGGSDYDKDDSIREAELENVYRELAEKTKPVPTRYQPQAPDLQSLRETWPSLPTDVTATTAEVVEKLSLLSERCPNGYYPPHELGRRLFEGKFVRFTNEEEKTEALEAAKKFAQENADKLSQEKGELVDAQSIDFKRVKVEEHKALIQSLAQGKYPAVEVPQATSSPVVGEILRSLNNNETYQATGKRSQFMAKLESLLVSTRPAKRA